MVNGCRETLRYVPESKRYSLHSLPGEELVGRSHAAGRVRENKGGGPQRGARGTTARGDNKAKGAETHKCQDPQGPRPKREGERTPKGGGGGRGGGGKGGGKRAKPAKLSECHSGLL